jgi:hypothetical protein
VVQPAREQPIAHVLLMGDVLLMARAVQMVHESASECASALWVVDDSPSRGRVDGSDDEVVDIMAPLLCR